MQKSTWILSGTAAVLLAASAVTRFAVYPAVHQLPGDTDSTFVYDGTMSTLNAEALAAGDMANLFLQDVPITLERRVQVVETDGSTAVVSDDVVVTGPEDTEMSATSHRWSIDRVDLDDRPAPDGVEAEEHQGLVISWPLEPEERDYTFWDPTTATEVPAVYERTEELEGRDVYVFQMEAAGPVGDPAIAGGLPEALPQSVLAAAAETLPEDQRPDLALLGQLPDPVPLTYTADVTRVAWIDSETGAVLDGALEQTIVAQTETPNGPVTLAPVSSMSVQGTEDGIAERADDAASAANLLWLVRMVIPLGLVVVALLLAAFAVWRELKSRGGSGRAAGDDEGAEPATA
ncbi:porin PorA family protein [Streptomyces litchfieldiae]|uniref:Porin PorA family protein n=1 Tax=Streptomyces litchfieldiae TaxID=3075543 RepID=A0ABU2MPZ1_9ACTN|nr:porin PorA family protein [Streptomyces sp. DSM 44938]MDT0343685.1 porin PorA family protein [Streptomyces sp. DSM 44938]